MTTEKRKPSGVVIVLIWLMIFYFIYLLFDKIIELQFNPNQQVISQSHAQGGVEVVLMRNKAGHYVANGEINNQAVIFMLDTGATDVTVPTHIAEKVGLEKGHPEQYRTANGIGSGYATRIPHISLGGIEMNNIRGGIVNNMSGNHILLGMSFLKHLEFTQRGDTLVLRQYPSL